MFNFGTAIYVADTYVSTAQEQAELLVSYVNPSKPYKIYFEKKGFETHNSNRQALQMLIEDVRNNCVNEIFVIDYEVFFGSPGDAAELYRILKKIKGLDLLDLSLLNNIKNGDDTHQTDIEQLAAFPFAYEAYIEKYRPRPKCRKVDKDTLIYIIHTDEDFLSLEEKITACTSLLSDGAKIKYIIDDYTNEDAELLGLFEVSSAIESEEIETLIVYEFGSFASNMDAYEQTVNSCRLHNVELKSVIDTETPYLSTVSSPGFGFYEY